MIVAEAWLNRVNAYAASNELTQSQAVRILVDEALDAIDASFLSPRSRKRTMPQARRS